MYNDDATSGWKTVKFGEVVNHIKDKVSDRDDWDFEVYIGGEHFDSGEIRVTKSNLIKGNEEVLGSAFHMRFKPGQVLYVSRNPRLRKGGIVNFTGVCSNVTFILEANEKMLLQSLLPFIIQSEDFVRHTTNNSHGSTNPFLNWKDIAKYKFRLPPLKEQKKISEILWAIEENIEKTESLLETTEELKKGLMNQLLTKGIEHSKFKETEIGQIPEDWEVVKLSKIAKVNYGKSNPNDSGNIPVIGSAGIYSRTSTPLIKDQTLVIGRKGNAGRVWLISEPSYPSDTTFYLLWKKYIEIKFIFYYMIFNPLTGENAKSTLPSIQKTELDNYLIPIPTIPEQKEIANILSSVDETIETYKSHISHLSNLKKKLTNEFLSGNIRIPSGVLKNVQ